MQIKINTKLNVISVDLFNYDGLISSLTLLFQRPRLIHIELFLIFVSDGTFVYRKTSNKRRASNKRRSVIDAGGGGGGVECTEINKRRPLINAGGTGQWYSDLDIPTQMSRTDLYSWTFSSLIKGFHIYKTSWEPYENEILTAKKESDNLYDVNAIRLFET